MTLLFMIFFHIVDDYYLQGILAKMKQKSFWENAGYKYKSDYIPALYMHAFSWAFMIMLPIAYNLAFKINSFYVWAFIVNFAIHAITDHLKANKKKINLCIDQTIHLLQILITFITYIIFIY